MPQRPQWVAQGAQLERRLRRRWKEIVRVELDAQETQVGEVLGEVDERGGVSDAVGFAG